MLGVVICIACQGQYHVTYVRIHIKAKKGASHLFRSILEFRNDEKNLLEQTELTFAQISFRVNVKQQSNKSRNQCDRLLIDSINYDCLLLRYNCSPRQRFLISLLNKIDICSSEIIMRKRQKFCSFYSPFSTDWFIFFFYIDIYFRVYTNMRDSSFYW